MAIQYSVNLRNAQLNQLAGTAGAAAKLRFYSGTKPASCATAASGTLLVEMTLPSTWMGSAASGSASMSGAWSGTGAAAAGAGTSAGYFRIYDSAGTNCHMQGTISAAGGGGDMTLDNVSIANGQNVAVNSFAVSAGNA